MILRRLLIIALLACATAVPAWANVAKIQEVTISNSGALTITAPVAGNSLILVTCYSSGQTLNSVSGGGVTWAITSAALTAGSRKCSIWYGHNSSGSGTSVTPSWSGVISLSPIVKVTEWSGLLNAAPEAANTNSGSGAIVTTNSVTPSSANSLVIAGMGGDSGTTRSTGPTNSFTALSASTNAGFHMDSAYQIESSAAAYSTGLTWSDVSAWQAVIAAFGASVPTGPTNAQRSAGFFAF